MAQRVFLVEQEFFSKHPKYSRMYRGATIAGISCRVCDKKSYETPSYILYRLKKTYTFDECVVIPSSLDGTTPYGWVGRRSPTGVTTFDIQNRSLVTGSTDYTRSKLFTIELPTVLHCGRNGDSIGRETSESALKKECGIYHIHRTPCHRISRHVRRNERHWSHVPSLPCGRRNNETHHDSYFCHRATVLRPWIASKKKIEYTVPNRF